MRIAASYFGKMMFETQPISALADLATVWSSRTDPQLPRFGLTEVEYTVHLARWYFGEVGNGGHFQYFFNPIGAYAMNTVDALEACGLPDAAAVLQQALEAWPGEFPVDTNLRQRKFDSIQEEISDLWDSLDYKIYAQSDYPETLLSYLRQNHDQVLAPERGL